MSKLKYNYTMLDWRGPEYYYDLILTNYNNGHELTYTKIMVREKDFKRGWGGICNKIKTTRFSGLNDSIFQHFLQKNKIKYIHGGTVDIKDIERFIASSEFNKKTTKIIKHKNIGNY